MFKIKIDTSGVEKMFKRLERNARELEQPRQVPLAELLTSEFMRTHSRFQSLDDYFTQCDVTVEKFKAMSDSDKDDLARQTSFSTWQELLNAAGAEYAKKQLFK